MSTFDRYLLRVFFRVLLVSFVSMTGLYIIIDLFGNLEEFISYANHQGSFLSVCVSYYGARVLSFYDRTSGLMALIASIFTITSLQRSNELTALMAAGISKARVIRPLIGATIVVALLASANRELILPASRDKLSRNAQNLLGEKADRLVPRTDRQTGIIIDGQHTIAANQEIENPSFRLPPALSPFGRQIVANRGYYQPPRGERPGGYLLEEVSRPDDLAKIPSVSLDGRPVIFSPSDASWLESNQCFVVSRITFAHLTAGHSLQRYSSTVELITILRNPSLDFGADTRVTLHSRLVQPLLDVTLLFLGLPLVLSRSNRNVFVAAGQCLLIVACFLVVALACHAMGQSSFLLSPALAAWCPLLIFGPIAYVAAQRRWE